MVSLGYKVGGAALAAAVSTPFTYVGGYLGGYIYAKFADLPAGQAGKAYAIWSVANNSINLFVMLVTTGVQYGNFVRAGTGALLSSAYVYDLRQKGLMGNKMMAVVIFFAVIGTIGELRSKETWVEKLQKFIDGL